DALPRCRCFVTFPELRCSCTGLRKVNSYGVCVCSHQLCRSCTYVAPNGYPGLRIERSPPASARVADSQPVQAKRRAGTTRPRQTHTHTHTHTHPHTQRRTRRLRRSRTCISSNTVRGNRDVGKPFGNTVGNSGLW